MSLGLVILWGLLLILVAMAVARADGTVERGAQRAIEQLAKLGPRMICALIASGFIAKLIPATFISRFMGEEAGFAGVLAGAAAGLIVPAGPVIAFPIAAVFARAGASTPALMAFITSWSLFAAHRIFIYEIPMLGPSFLRMRLVSVAALPFLAGLLAMLVGLVVTIDPTGSR